MLPIRPATTGSKRALILGVFVLILGETAGRFAVVGFCARMCQHFAAQFRGSFPQSLADAFVGSFVADGFPAEMPSRFLSANESPPAILNHVEDHHSYLRFATSLRAQVRSLMIRDQFFELEIAVMKIGWGSSPTNNIKILQPFNQISGFDNSARSPRRGRSLRFRRLQIVGYVCCSIAALTEGSRFRSDGRGRRHGRVRHCCFLPALGCPVLSGIILPGCEVTSR